MLAAIQFVLMYMCNDAMDDFVPLDVDEDPSEMTREELAAKIGQARNEFARIPSASSIGWDTFPPLPNIGPPQIPGMQMQMQPRPPGQVNNLNCIYR